MLYRHKKIDYTVPSGHEGGPGVGKQITPYVGTPYINMTAAQWAAMGQSIGASLGDTWTLGGGSPALGGNTFQFVRASEALTIGQLVSVAVPETTTAHGVGTTAVVTTHYDTSLLAANAEVGNWIFVNTAAATSPQLRRIKANTAAVTSAYTVALPDYMRPSSPTDADAFDIVSVDNDPTCIIRPHHVIVCTELMTPVGVALGTVTNGNYTIIQIRGLASVSAIGDTTATVVNVPAVPAAAGQIAGSAAAAANLFTGAASILPQLATAAAAPGLIIPCYVNFMYQ